MLLSVQLSHTWCSWYIITPLQTPGHVPAAPSGRLDFSVKDFHWRQRHCHSPTQWSLTPYLLSKMLYQSTCLDNELLKKSLQWNSVWHATLWSDLHFLLQNVHVTWTFRSHSCHWHYWEQCEGWLPRIQLLRNLNIFKVNLDYNTKQKSRVLTATTYCCGLC